jgi:hypothetical protein
LGADLRAVDRAGCLDGRPSAPYDFAVIHVTPEDGSLKSLKETVGSALPVEFDAPVVPEIGSITATGYPAAPPFDGQSLFQCADKPGRLSISESEPTVYRIACTMTGGASGGGWFAEQANGDPALVSNTSIGQPPTAGSPARTWVRAPRRSSPR